mgnify:FL=1
MNNQLKVISFNISRAFIFFLFFTASQSRADVIDGSHLDGQFRSFSLDRNYLKNGSVKNKEGSYSTGILINYSSGYTDTFIAAGFDLDAQYAVRLSSTGNDGSLPFNTETNKTSPHYSRLGGTLKFKIKDTLLKVGNVQPDNPLLATEDTRMLPSIAQGAIVESRPIQGLLLSGGQFWSQVTRQSSNQEKFYLAGQTEYQGSNKLTFAGVEYKLTPETDFKEYYGVLTNIYRQNYSGISHIFNLDDSLNLNLSARYNQFWKDGDARAGNIDNRSYGLMAGLAGISHSIAFSYQRMLGETGYPQLAGDTPLTYLVNYGSLGFNNRDEKSWSVRYRYVIHAGILEGLGAGLRYSRGTNINLGNGSAKAKESETDISLTYHPQKAELKNLGLTLLYVPVRQSAGVDVNTLRLLLTYNFSIL